MLDDIVGKGSMQWEMEQVSDRSFKSFYKTRANIYILLKFKLYIISCVCFETV